MSDATSNLNNIEADSVRTWDPVVKRYVDIREGVVGLAPETLDTLGKIANSIANDPEYATYVDGQLALKAPIANPTFTGTVAGVTKAMVGLASVDNTSDAAKPVSTAQQAALDLKAPVANPTFTGTVGGITKAMVGLSSVDNTADAAKPVSTAQQAALDLKAPLASPAFTGTVSGITKAMVGLGSVDNTSDAAKPVSTAQQAALDTKATPADIAAAIDNLVGAAPGALDTLNELAAALGNDANFATTTTNQIATKAPLANPTFTGTVSGITKAMVGLGSVDNTSDVAKPISTATQAALDLKADSSDLTNNAAAWSSGLSSDAYHYIDTGTDALVIRTNGGAISANFLGNVGGAATEGKALFYKDVEVFGDLLLSGQTLDSKLALKADLADVFEKVISGADTILQLNSKFRLVAAAGTVKLQYWDNDGTIVTDAWLDVAEHSFDTNANTSSLAVNGVDILTSLAAKATQSTVDAALALKANSSDVAASLAGKQDKLIHGEVVPASNFARVLDSGDTRLRAIQGSGAVTVAATDYSKITIGADCYTKGEANDLLSGKEPVFIAVAPLQKVFNLGVTPARLELRLDTGNLAPLTNPVFPGTLEVIQDAICDARLYCAGNSYFTGPLTGFGGATITGTTTTDTLVANTEVVADSMRASTANALTIADNLVVTGDLTVNGTSNVGGNPYWVAGRVQNTTILQSKGQQTFTITMLAAGFYRINFAQPHPDGSNYIALALGEGYAGSAWNIVNNANTTTYANTDSSTVFIIRDQNMTAVSAAFNFVVLA
jgi:hypothetical protein